MLSVEIIERMLVNSIIVEARLNEPLDALLSRLLSHRPGYSSHASLGVTLGYQLVSQQQVMAAGIVVMYGRTVEPIRLELTLDAGRRHLTAGRLSFGDAGRSVGYGPTEQDELLERLLTEPDAHFAWKERFRRGDDGWHHEAGAP